MSVFYDLKYSRAGGTTIDRDGEYRVIETRWRVYLVKHHGGKALRLAEVIGDADDFRRIHGSVGRWVQKVKRAKTRRVKKIRAIIADLETEIQEYEDVLDLKTAPTAGE